MKPIETFKLEAKNAREARAEASRRWPKNDVRLIGFKGNDAVYISLVRNVSKGPVATATKGIAANRFEARVVE